jgi:hypothetical protein
MPLGTFYLGDKLKGMDPNPDAPLSDLRTTLDRVGCLDMYAISSNLAADQVPSGELVILTVGEVADAVSLVNCLPATGSKSVPNAGALISGLWPVRATSVCVPREAGDQVVHLLNKYSVCKAGHTISDATALSDTEIQAVLNIAHHMGERSTDVQSHILGTRISARALVNAWTTNRILTGYKDRYFANITNGLAEQLQVSRVTSAQHATQARDMMMKSSPWISGSSTITNGVHTDKDARESGMPARAALRQILPTNRC